MTIFLMKIRETKQADSETTASDRKLSGIKKLDTIEGACMLWMKEHPNPKYTPSVVKRKPIIQKLLISVSIEKKGLLEEIQKKHDEGGGGETDADKQLMQAYGGRGLMPYTAFVKRVDNISMAAVIPVSGIMKLRRKMGSDSQLTKLLETYQDYEKSSGGKSDLDKAANKDTIKRVTELRYQKLMNLEKACNDWLTAHKSKAGMLYTVKTLSATPATARRDLIGALVEKDGPIEHEKLVLKANFGVITDIANKEKGGEQEADKVDFDSVSSDKRTEIYEYEEFKKITDAGKTSTRGDNLSKIDELIKQYHEQKKENRRGKGKPDGIKKEIELLKKIFTGATYWLNLHENDTGGSVLFRMPVIKELAEIAREKLLSGGEADIDSLDAGKNFGAAMGFKGVSQNKEELPTPEEFLKLTYVSKLNRRDKDLKELDQKLAEYHQANCK